MSARNDIDRLKFPSGLSVRQAKSNAKILKTKLGIKLHEAQHKVAAANGLDMPWEQAIESIRAKEKVLGYVAGSKIKNIEQLAKAMGGTLVNLRSSEEADAHASLLEISKFRPDHANIIQIQDEYDGVEFVSERTFPVYPSAFVKVPPQNYYDAASDENINWPCIFFDGEVIIVPESYAPVIQYLIERHGGEVVATGQMKEHEFATLAIKKGVRGELVSLGDALLFPAESVHQMLESALSNPEQTLMEWKEIYRSSMDAHAIA